MIAINVRDHPRRKLSECWDWCKANAKGRWDFVQVDSRNGRAWNAAIPDFADEMSPTLAKACATIRQTNADRSENWGDFYDRMTMRVGSRGLSVLMTCVKIKMVFDDPADAKAFRRWLRKEDQS